MESASLPLYALGREKKHPMDDKAEKTALFRYGLIAPLVLETLPRGELTRRAQEIAARLYDIPYSGRRSLSVDTLLDWALRYRKDGLAALSPKPRQDHGQPRAVPPETAALIERLKRENPSPHRYRPAAPVGAHQRAEQGRPVFLHPLSFPARPRPHRTPTAARQGQRAQKVEAQFANQIWQSDMLFGPWVERPGGGKRQVFLQAALDDASRLIPHARFHSNAPRSAVPWSVARMRPSNLWRGARHFWSNFLSPLVNCRLFYISDAACARYHHTESKPDVVIRTKSQEWLSI